MQVIDLLLYRLLTPFINATCPHLSGCFVGAMPQTQPLGIAHELHSVIEKSLDDHSQGCVAQQDIEKYYDSIHLLLVSRWLLRTGAPRTIVACALRQQMMPQVVLKIGEVKVKMPNRASGSLTGSRVAGALGRVPVESIIQDRHAEWQRHGYNASTCTLTVCTDVDNIYSASRSLEGALTILEDFADQLRIHWRLNIKASSRQCMVPRGSAETVSDADRWKQVREFLVLGHILDDNGYTASCWRATSRAMWRAFFANSGAATAAKLSVKDKMSLLQRSVVPALQHRNTRWPPNGKTSADIDRLQRKMVASIQRVTRAPGEAPAEYIRRRNRAATFEIRKIGK
jgi:hypothetical protein